MVGSDLQRRHSLGLHLPQEVHEVATVGFDRVVGRQHVADPRHQSPGRDGVSVAGHGLQGAGEKGLDLGRGRSVAFEEIAALRHQGGAGWHG